MPHFVFVDKNQLMLPVRAIQRLKIIVLNERLFWQQGLSSQWVNKLL